VVAGKRGGLAPGFIPGQYLGVEAGDEQAARLFPGDALAVETYGRGLALLDFPQVAVLNCSPRILDALSIGMESGALHLPVRAELPGVAAGAGLGSDPWIGDLEIAFGAPEGLRFGDVVAFGDTDARVSRAYRRGFVAIGVVSHGPSPVPGHGFGVTILLSGPREQVQPRISEDAALAPSLLQWREEEKPEWT
jgi:hypothetical protein